MTGVKYRRVRKIDLSERIVRQEIPQHRRISIVGAHEMIDPSKGKSSGHTYLNLNKRLIDLARAM